MRPILSCFFLVGAWSLAASTLTACEPEITSNTYFCGANQTCPENLTCDLGDEERFVFSCVNRLEARPFACTEFTADVEPDDSAEQAQQLGSLECGGQFAFESYGCIESGSDVDHFQFEREAVCVGTNPHTQLTLHFPVGPAPLSLRLVDENGTAIAEGERCTPEDNANGTEVLCISEPDLPVGSYTVRVGLESQSGGDCDGNCRYNRYQLFLSSPLSL